MNFLTCVLLFQLVSLLNTQLLMNESNKSSEIFIEKRSLLFPFSSNDLFNKNFTDLFANNNVTAFIDVQFNQSNFSMTLNASRSDNITSYNNTIFIGKRDSQTQLKNGSFLNETVNNSSLIAFSHEAFKSVVKNLTNEYMHNMTKFASKIQSLITKNILNTLKTQVSNLTSKHQLRYNILKSSFLSNVAFTNKTNSSSADFAADFNNESAWWLLNETIYYIKVVSLEKSADSSNSNNETRLSSVKLSFLQQLIEHAILKHFSGNLHKLQVAIQVNNSTDKHVSAPYALPIKIKVILKSPIKVLRHEFDRSLIDYSINEQKCIIDNERVKCLNNQKDDESLLRLANVWIQLKADSSNETMIPLTDKLTIDRIKMFSYQPAWIIGLIVIGSIIALFFIGCIFAVCYTRRPYRRSSKIYEVETSKIKKRNVPQIPGINPTTKASTITKSREFYY